MEPLIEVEVAYALPTEQVLVRLQVPAGTTVGEAVERSGLAGRFAGIETARVGVFGQERPRDAVLRDGDRVEIYRPLRADPQELRRARARRGAAD